MRKLVALVMVVLAFSVAACDAQLKETTVYPEAGYPLSSTETSKDGSMACVKDVLATQLTRGGTISVNGVTVTFLVTDKGATLTFNGGIPFNGAIVNGRLAVALPKKTSGYTRLRLFNADFGSIESITLCGRRA